MDEVLEALRALHADVPEPDAATRRRAYIHATSVTAPSRRRHRARVVIPALVAALAVATAATAAWRVSAERGEAHARRVVGAFLDATSPSHGWIVAAKLDLRVLPVGGRPLALKCEFWSQRRVPTRFRATTAFAQKRYDAVGQLRPREGYVFDRLLHALYRTSKVPAVAATELQAWAGDPSFLLRQEGANWNVTEATINGRAVYRISRRGRADDAPAATFLIDRKSFAPISATRTVEVTGCGVPQLGAKRQQASVTYRYLPPTDENLRLIATPTLRPSRILGEPQLPLVIAALFGDASAQAALKAGAAQPRSREPHPARGGGGPFEP